MEGLDALQFQLNYDCSSLNSWNNETLKMIGVAVQLAPEPIMPGEDALDEVRRIEIKQNRQRRRELRQLKASQAEQEDISVEESVITSSLQSSEAPSETSTGEASDKESADTEEMRGASAVSTNHLKLLIEANDFPTPDIIITPTEDLPSPSSSGDDGSALAVTPSKFDSASIGGNSLGSRQGWSSSPPVKINRDRDSNHSNRDLSYESVLNSYSMEAVLSSTPDFRDLSSSTPIQRMNSLKERTMSLFDTKRRIIQAKKADHVHEIAFGNIGDFEVIPKSVVLNNAEPETQLFLVHFCRLGNEVGLDQQNYKCNSCGRPIGMIYGKSRICKFDGFNYCVDCHANEEMTIPARIIHNWDFKVCFICFIITLLRSDLKNWIN